MYGYMEFRYKGNPKVSLHRKFNNFLWNAAIHPTTESDGLPCGTMVIFE